MLLGTKKIVTVVQAAKGVHYGACAKASKARRTQLYSLHRTVKILAQYVSAGKISLFTFSCSSYAISFLCSNETAIVILTLALAPIRASMAPCKRSSSKKSNQAIQQPQPFKFGIQHFLERHTQSNPTASSSLENPNPSPTRAQLLPPLFPKRTRRRSRRRSPNRLPTSDLSSLLEW